MDFYLSGQSVHKSAPSNDMYIAISVFVFVAGLFLFFLGGGGGGGVTFNLFLSFVLCLSYQRKRSNSS